MSGVSCVSSSSAASMMQVLNDSMQSQTDMAEKFVKIAAEEKVQAQQLSMLGQVIDRYV